MKKLFYLLLLSLTFNFANAQSLVSMSPNTLVAGAAPSLTSTITGIGTFFQSGSPPNSLTEAYITDGLNTYNGDTWGAFPTDDEHVDVLFFYGAAPVSGTYSLIVTYYDPNVITWPFTTTLTLPGAFTILPPDGYVQGTVFEDANQNGIQDGGEVGLQGVSMTVNPGNKTFTSGVNGVFSYPLTNGSYTLTYNNSSANYLFLTTGATNPINFTISSANSTGNNFPLYRGLNSVYPDSAWLGQNMILNVYSDKGIFRPGNVQLGSGTRLIKSSGSAYTVNSSQVTYIDTNHVQIRFIFSSNSVYLGNYNLEVTTTSVYSGKHILRNCFDVGQPPLFISGYVFLDIDSDAVKDPLEIGIANQKVLLMPDSTYAFSDATGNYFFGSSSGTKTISWLGGNGYLIQTNNVSSYTQNITTTTSGFKFGIKNPNPDYKCDILYFSGAGRCNVQNSWYFTYQNKGNVPFNGWLYVLKSPNVSFVSASVIPTFVSGDSLGWYFTNLMPSEIRYLNMIFLMPAAGQAVSFKAVMHSLDVGNNVIFADEYFNNFTVSCAWDPNDKRVNPEGVQAQHYTLMSDTLSYHVRFQNTGNDTAFVVLIRDTIDANFDLSTFNVTASSHTMNTELDLETRIAKFTFNNILLPDSNVNEPASHGFVSFTIKAKAGLPENTLVENDADIYFDFNPPVITNETFNTLVSTLAPVPDFTSNDLRVCATQSVTFNNLTTGATSYQWTFPGGTPASSTLANPTIQYLVKGTYDVTLVATNAIGNNSITKTAYVLIDSLSVAAVTPAGNTTICKGQSILLSSQATHASFSYQWEKNNVNIPGATSATYNASQQATYRVKVTNGLGCTKRSANKTVFTSQPTAPISAAGNTTFCSGGNVQLQTNGSVTNTFQWKKNNNNIGGANAPVYAASSHGNYRVLVTDQNGCTNISAVIPVRVNPNPNVTVSANGPLTFCAGQNVTLSVNAQANVTYQWKDNNINIGGATSNQYTATTAGKYKITATNAVTTCTNSSSTKNVIINCRVAGENVEEESSSFKAYAYPNPASTETKIYLQLPQDRMVSVDIIDMTGRNIGNLLNTQLSAGSYDIAVNAKEYAAGVYFVAVSAGNEKQIIKLILNSR
jgi:uncharacterized repeat protein (TIGR01451 family)